MSIRDKLISGPLGFGSAPLGNMFRNIPEAEAAATVDAAWQQGIRYFDTAPLYGAGLSEMRLGRALAKHKRGKYVLSSKVGRLILDEVESGPRHLGEKGNLFEFGRPNRMVYDYSADGTRRSIEDSLKRLGVDRLPEGTSGDPREGRAHQGPRAAPPGFHQSCGAAVRARSSCLGGHHPGCQPTSTAAIIPGASRPERIAEDRAACCREDARVASCWRHHRARRHCVRRRWRCVGIRRQGGCGQRMSRRGSDAARHLSAE